MGIIKINDECTSFITAFKRCVLISCFHPFSFITNEDGFPSIQNNSVISKLCQKSSDIYIYLNVWSNEQSNNFRRGKNILKFCSFLASNYHTLRDLLLHHWQPLFTCTTLIYNYSNLSIKVLPHKLCEYIPALILVNIYAENFTALITGTCFPQGKRG